MNGPTGTPIGTAIEYFDLDGRRLPILPATAAGKTAWRLLKPGEGIVYHRGDLATDRRLDVELAGLADHLLREQEAARAILTRRRLGERGGRGWAYIAFKPRPSL